MKITETVTDITSLLGGPEISAEDIDWALDVPAGQRLLDWLVSQVEGETDGPDQLRAALQVISLEENEVEMSVLFSIESGFGLMALGCDTPPRKRPLRCTVLPPSPKCPRGT